MAKPRRHDPTTIDVRAESFSIIEAAAGEGQPKIPRFDMLAYTGGPLRLGNFTNPVVADLAGMKIPSQSRPVRLQHDANMGVGHTDMIANDGRCLKASGIVSRSTPAAADVVASGLNGFPWQASMGCSIEAKEYLAPGATAFVNGQTISGPCIIARQTTLRELTICDAGADDQTSVNIAASAAQTTKEFIMDPNFQEWLQAKGFNPDLLADVGVSTLEAAWEAEIKAAQVETPDPKTIQATSPVADIRAESAAESLRISAVRKACGGKHGEIEAKAIAEGWDETKTELAVIRAERPKAPAGHVANHSLDGTVIEAAIRLGTAEQQSIIEAAYKPEILDRAYPLRGIGLRGLIQACCAMDGREAPAAWAQEGEVIRAAFSTASLPGILSAAMNKTLLSAYQAVPSTAKRIAQKLTANDFKTHTGYRLTGDAMMKEVGANGELKHGTLGEQSFTYSVKTHGRIYGITRQMLKNDDLGALMGIPRMLGRGAALALEDCFWTLVLANTGNFFHGNNKNLSTGSALASAGLGKAVQKLRDQTDPDGNPVLLSPKFVVCPTALEETAWELFKSTNIAVSGTTDAVRANANIYAGLYEPVVTPYLGNSTYAGYSATSWYLFADPQDIAAFGLAYLDGNEQPTIQDAPQDPDVLGQGWRGFFDFGVCQLDPRGAVKATA
jgi:hypothetical protein